MNDKNNQFKGDIMGDRAIEAFLMRKGLIIVEKNIRGQDGSRDIPIVYQADGAVVGCDLRVSIGGATSLLPDPERINSVHKTLSIFTNSRDSLRNKPKKVDILNIVLDRRGRLVSIDHIENVSRETF